MTDYGRTERLALCDLLDTVGPDHPTLCEGWTTYDLAAHLYVREADPLAGPGLMIPSLSDTTEKRMADAKARLPYPELVAKVRNGPPTFSIYSLPFLGPKLNVTEYFVHHEDVRRAGAAPEPRDLPPAHQEQLWNQVRIAAKGITRRADVGLALRRPDGTTHTVRRGGPADSVIVTGEPSELVLFCFGRGAVAKVSFEGPAAAIDRLRATRFTV